METETKIAKYVKFEQNYLKTAKYLQYYIKVEQKQRIM